MSSGLSYTNPCGQRAQTQSYDRGKDQLPPCSQSCGFEPPDVGGILIDAVRERHQVSISAGVVGGVCASGHCVPNGIPEPNIAALFSRAGYMGQSLGKGHDVVQQGTLSQPRMWIALLRYLLEIIVTAIRWDYPDYLYGNGDNNHRNGKAGGRRVRHAAIVCVL